MRVLGRRFLLLLVLSLAGCPKRVVVNGQEMPVSQANEVARVELARVRQEVAALPPEPGADRLLAFAQRFRGVPSAADALHQAGDLLLAAGKADRAAQAYGTLVSEYPLHPRATEAKYGLALADVQRGHAADGLRTLASIYPQLEPSRRPEAAARAAAAAEAAGAWPDAVRWLGELADLTQGEERRAVLARGADAVDRLALPDVERLRKELPREAPLQEPLAMKAARIHLHLRDYPRAQEAAREVFLRWPAGPYAKDARAIVDRIARLTFVRPNVIGVAVPLSGDYQPWGVAIVRAVQLAAEGGGVRVAVRDTRGEPDGAAQALEALALEEGAIAVVGGVTNAEAERAAATAEELQLPFISLSKQEGLTDAGPHVFQNMLTASAQAKALADFAMGRRGMRRFAVMYPSITYGTELANAFWDEVEGRGGEIRGAETYAPDRTTFTPLVKDMVGKLHLEERSDWQEQQRDIAKAEKDPFRRKKALEKARDRLAPVVDFDAIFIPDFARSVKLIAPALAVEDVVTQTCLPDDVERIRKTTGRADLRPVQLLGANGWSSDPSLFDTAPGGAGRYVRCAIFVDGFYAGSARPATKAFVEAFERRHAGQVPTILEASAFDAAGMARAQLGKAQTRDQMRDALAAVKGYVGATGDITMGPRRTPEKPLFFLTVDRDGLRELTPEELAGPGPGQP
ncbi:ABC branched chain amino acid transporter, periplasmic ligand binding protein [Anaeromyxobacter sp. K]|uniref:ABC transporter substrate-binding protein n=1 Tax=Anaeromyxobacter sp. (strain K) TaxID=447217 RepID=UPI00015F9D4A|nr:penicillin-binding protein activator [Anaeromyxobacter sp. K]ACG75665.1 ABC branched chain amino acid transporter, periplasmic ligand binding protein [Anaeromyxobacter sp. K]